jgi:thiosulfate reductase cytochrome b subunit
MNERDYVQRNDEAHSAAESSPKPASDQPAEPTEAVLQVQRTDPPSDASTKPADDAPKSSVISTGQAAHDPSCAQTDVDGISRKDAPREITITIEHKHSLAIRWMHWLNFPLLAVMIYSGLLIYWADSQHEGLNAHRVYRIGFGSWTLFRFFPPWFYNNLHLKFQLAKGLGYHFFFTWFFALNGIAYVLYTLFSGEWRELLPTRHSFVEAVEVTLHDLGLTKCYPPQGKFNGAQRIAYTGVICMGAGSLLTGLAIYKPTQLHLFTLLLGGYEMARWLHFWLTMSYVAFFLVHVAQIIRAGWNNFRAMIIGYEILPNEAAKRDEHSL